MPMPDMPMPDMYVPNAQNVGFAPQQNYPPLYPAAPVLPSGIQYAHAPPPPPHYPPHHGHY